MRVSPEHVTAALDEIRKVVPADRVISGDAVQQAIARDLTEEPWAWPDAVVQVSSAESHEAAVREIQAVIRACANPDRPVPVVPMVQNTNVGALAVPSRGGIVIDMRRMTRVLHADDRNGYLVIEPGVSFGDIRKLLDEKYPAWRFGYSLSPPETSVVANFLMDGLSNLSLKHGATGEWLNGVEAVMPDGSLMKTGLGAVSPFWVSRAPLPDLTAMFISTYGTTGVIASASVQIWPNPAFRKRLFILSYDVDATFALTEELARRDICDDIGGISWPMGKMLFGETMPMFRSPTEPLLFLYIDVSAHDRSVFDAKLGVLGERVAAARRAGAQLEDPLDIKDLVKLEPLFGKFAEFPTRLSFLLDHEGEGLTWVGTYGPCSEWVPGVKRGFEVMHRLGYPPSVVTRPMRGGRYGVLRFIAIFDRRSREECERVRKLNEALADVCVELGWFPYKSPAWAIERYRDRFDPGFLRQFAALRRHLDPAGIMNPGQWPTGDA